jgi:hypothetical protein
MPNPRPNDDPRSAALRDQLNTAHRGLLAVHKSLIDHERARYERAWGPVPGPMEFLQLLLTNPFFAWLRPMSELIVQLDETSSTREPVNPAVASALLQQSRTLLTPSETGDEFAREYHRAIQESPPVATAHGDWRASVHP